ncbi:hypothetical protein CRUP_002224 [Coryphaenoides rupestris]|nr:hypothetical protein CRUP_002224 [Coryphaenoides rupestris]
MLSKPETSSSVLRLGVQRRTTSAARASTSPASDGASACAVDGATAPASRPAPPAAPPAPPPAPAPPPPPPPPTRRWCGTSACPATPAAWWP